jgi:Polyketide cyclase / dehydrase and lipid transport
MARYSTSIESKLPQAEAFAYMADFSNCGVWDPSIAEIERVGDGPLGVGAAWDLVAGFGGRAVPLRYTIVEYEEPIRVVLEAPGKGFTSLDTITVTPSGEGSKVTYEALLSFHGVRRLLDPIMQRLFRKVGDAARDGMRAALNP